MDSCQSRRERKLKTCGGHRPFWFSLYMLKFWGCDTDSSVARKVWSVINFRVLVMAKAVQWRWADAVYNLFAVAQYSVPQKKWREVIIFAACLFGRAKETKASKNCVRLYQDGKCGYSTTIWCCSTLRRCYTQRSWLGPSIYPPPSATTLSSLEWMSQRGLTASSDQQDRHFLCRFRFRWPSHSSPSVWVSPRLHSRGTSGLNCGLAIGPWWWADHQSSTTILAIG